MEEINKNSPASQALEMALSYYASGQLLVAEEMYQKVLLQDPKNVVSLSMLGIIASESGRYEAAVNFLDQAIKTKKNDPVLFGTMGMILQKWGKLDEALLQYKKAVSFKPDYVDVHAFIGDILKDQGKFGEAELKYKRVIALKPDHAAAHFCLGQVLKEQGKLDEAVLVYQKAIALKPDLAEAYNNLGLTFYGQKKFEAAAEMYKRSISVKPDSAKAYFNLGLLFENQRNLDEAIRHYAKSIAIKPDFVEAHTHLGSALKTRGMLNEAVLLYEQALILRPDNAEYLAAVVHSSHEACAWDKINGYEVQLLDMVRHKCKGIHPFKILWTPSTAEDQLICAGLFNRSKEQPHHLLFTHAPERSGNRIRIGYLSSDFRAHAIAYLMAELFERHDRSRFSITAYSDGEDDKSPMRKRLMKAFDNFVDLGSLSAREAAQKIYDDGTDILIDISGSLTGGGRCDIPAWRPAPVQVSYLGYPGTTGASFIDYIIADRFIIPEEQEKFYSEKVVCLPDCYQPNDTHRQIAEIVPTREAHGLPEKGFVFCCFNSNCKITPQVFDIWMRLLQKVPHSVLWLYEENKSVKGNLLREAERRGVTAERLVFAPRMPLPDHLARHRLADLFLDTLPVNAHTTASDALWAGLPVLTCAGETFAGRVAGSLLKAANLPELITYSLEEYEALALQLAQNPAQLTVLRQKLQQMRLQVPLFDIGKFTKNIEKSYQTMWDIWQAGDNPKAFTV